MNTSAKFFVFYRQHNNREYFYGDIKERGVALEQIWRCIVLQSNSFSQKLSSPCGLCQLWTEHHYGLR